jgi:pSer/pThr/pTyr-binding forkhead associated (FHA) protein
VGFRLRYLQHDLELREGEFAVGRHASCQLSVDDPLVSRRHALLLLRAGEVTIEDLGSRNGVLVNGEKIKGRAKLKAGDKVLVGSQEMTLVQSNADDAAERVGRPTGTMARVTLNASHLDDTADEDSDTRTWAGPIESVDDLAMLKRVDGLRVLVSVAEKALVMGRVDDAERMISASLNEVLDGSRRGTRIPAVLAEQAARFGAKLANATGKASWGDYAIEIYSTMQKPAPAMVIDELYTAFRKPGTVDLAKVKAYVELLRGLLSSFGPAERFLFQRIEGLERLVALRS